jgi:hypothetical protein
MKNLQFFIVTVVVLFGLNLRNLIGKEDIGLLISNFTIKSFNEGLLVYSTPSVKNVTHRFYKWDVVQWKPTAATFIKGNSASDTTDVNTVCAEDSSSSNSNLTRPVTSELTNYFLRTKERTNDLSCIGVILLVDNHAFPVLSFSSG